MWQQIVVTVLVLLALLSAAWKLAPRQWRRRFGPRTPPEASTPDCGCGTGKRGCH
jgi:hypothetical protein